MTQNKSSRTEDGTGNNNLPLRIVTEDSVRLCYLLESLSITTWYIWMALLGELQRNIRVCERCIALSTEASQDS
jgi:hypothetical protein